MAVSFSSLSLLTVVDKRQIQKKDTIATKTTRKCGGTTPKFKVWTGAQIDQYFVKIPLVWI